MLLLVSFLYFKINSLDSDIEKKEKSNNQSKKCNGREERVQFKDNRLIQTHNKRNTWNYNNQPTKQQTK